MTMHVHLMNTQLMYLCALGAALLIVGNVWLFIRVLRPLYLLTRQAAALERGQLEAFEQPIQGIREIEQLRRSMAGMVGHVRRAQAQSRAYADALADGQEVERSRLAHELHDDTVQAVIAIAQGIDLAQQWITHDPDKSRTMLQITRTQAADTVIALRNLIGNLRPPALEELGLVAAIKMLATGEHDMKVELKIEGIERRLSAGQELALFRSIQEALTNARRHGQATLVKVILEYQPQGVRVTISDNGQGIDLMPQDVGMLALDGHYGLIGIRERVRQTGGSFQIQSQFKQGTTLILYVPSDRRLSTDEIEMTDIVRDPVCSAVITPEQAYGSLEYQGERYYFCCPVCQGAFQRDPELYLKESNIKINNTI
ncbi:MAG TPA: histidine kinase [Phototrophicaceae bacterium]|nr:histidine kinase [Phototrophicaceae bacterium]